MAASNDAEKLLAERAREASSRRERLAIRGSGSKRFYTGELSGTPLDVTTHRGIVSYEPTELVITARAGTSLAEIESALATNRQMLAFEPPRFGEDATLGGTLACGLSGPRRPYTGSARDFVLGARIVNGQGEALRFGGQVMKNVAGFDISRLMVGSLGTLGVLLEASLKVLPMPARELTITFAMNAAQAIECMNAWAGQPLPLSGACHHEGILRVRLSGADKAVEAARKTLGGDALAEGDVFWHNLREQRLAFFQENLPVWRLSLPAATAPLDLSGEWLLDWGGAQRWLVSDAPAERIHAAANEAGGYARVFRNGPGALSTFDLLTPAVSALTSRLHTAFDPHRVFGGLPAQAA